MIKGVLLDIGGVIQQGGEVLPGAIAAIEKLRHEKLSIVFLTNTTRMPLRAMCETLHRLGIKAKPEEFAMPAQAALDYCRGHGLRPYLLIHPALHEDFDGLPQDKPNALIVGDAAEGFTFTSLNKAFRVLENGATFLALAKNRSFMDDDGKRSLDTGAFVAALEYASEREALVLGKPAPDFYRSALKLLDCEAGEAVMVGDDVEADVAGAMSVGIRGILVRSGKYRAGDESRIDPRPDRVVDDLAAAVDWIVDTRDHN